MEFNEELYDHLENHFIKQIYNHVYTDDHYVIFTNIIYKDRAVTFLREEINYTFLRSFCDATIDTDFGKVLNDLLNTLPEMLRREQTIEKLLS